MNVLSIGDIATRMGATILSGDPEHLISDYSFNSREGKEQTLFLPTVGERVDAHNFIPDARRNGIRCTVTERGIVPEGCEDMTVLAVDSTREALHRLGASVRNDYADLPMVGITGSVGKTTTKELVAAALSAGGTVLKTEGNKNGQLGVPLMMMELSKEQDFAVIEMGMSMFGEMARLSKVAMPNYAIITNIGVSHIGNLGSRENIRKEKLCIINDLKKPAVVFVNGDDELLSELVPASPNFHGYESIALYDETREKLSEVTFLSYGKADWCDYRAEDIFLSDTEVRFRYVGRKEETTVTLPIPGAHNVGNALAALALSEWLNVSAETAKAGLMTYRPMAMRGNVEWLKSGVCLIDDTYNASPDSMKSGLGILDSMKGTGRRIAVLADILELGDQSEACHRLVGTYVAESKTDILLTVGKDAHFIAEEAQKKPGLTVYSFTQKEEAEACLLILLAAGDMVLLKGSRGMGLDQLAKMVRENAIC